MKYPHIEALPTNPYEFEGATAAEIGYDTKSLDQRYIEWIDGDLGQRVGVYETQPHREVDVKPDVTILMQASHDYRLEPLWMRNMDIIASRTGARVVGVETPGTVGLLKAGDDGSWSVYDSTERLSGDRQTAGQLFGALRGEFVRHAEVQLRAIRETVGLGESERIILLGESMGASVATDTLALARDQDLAVSDLVLYEMVNSHQGHNIAVPLRLMNILPGVENDRRTQGFMENAEIGHPMMAFEMMSERQRTLDEARKKLGQQGIAALVNGIGMAQGKRETLATNLLVTLVNGAGMAHGKLDTLVGGNMPNITLVRGRESLATNRSDYINLAGMLHDRGVKVTVHEVVDTSPHKRDMGHEAVRASLGRRRPFADFISHRVIEQEL